MNNVFFLIMLFPPPQKTCLYNNSNNSICPRSSRTTVPIALLVSSTLPFYAINIQLIKQQVTTHVFIQYNFTCNIKQSILAGHVSNKGLNTSINHTENGKDNIEKFCLCQVFYDIYLQYFTLLRKQFIFCHIQKLKVS